MASLADSCRQDPELKCRRGTLQVAVSSKKPDGCRQQKPTQLLSTCAFCVSSVRASGDASEVGVPKVCFYELMITGIGLTFSFTVTLFRHWA